MSIRAISSKLPTSSLCSFCHVERGFWEVPLCPVCGWCDNCGLRFLDVPHRCWGVKR